MEDTKYNVEWKRNKSQIKALYSTKGITQELINYSNNLILFYEKKITEVKGLIERKSSDGRKNFIGDTTIQDEQKKIIGKMLWNDPSTKKMTDKEKMDLISGYYKEIGSEAGKIMEKDYNDRNRTIKYLLLIREYEDNIEKIKDAIQITDAIQLSNKAVDVSNIYEDDEDEGSFLDGGKKIMRGGYNSKILPLYTLLVEEYGNILNSPLTDPELQTYLIQYFDKLQFLIADPVNVDTTQFKEVSQQLLDRINFLNENQYGGQNGGVGDDKRGFLSKIGDNLAGKTMRAMGLGAVLDYDDDDDIPYTPTDKEKEEMKEEGFGQDPAKVAADKFTNEWKESVDKFVNSDDLLELDNMLKSGKITNVDVIEDSTGETAFVKAVSTNNHDKMSFLISRGANINQKYKNKGTLLQKIIETTNAADLITWLIRLGASKDGIDPTKIKNVLNKKAFINAKYTEKDNKKFKTDLDKDINDLLKKKEVEKNENLKDQMDPKHPLYRQWKQLQDSQKKRDDNFKKWSDEMKKLLDYSKDTTDKIEQVRNGTLTGPQKYEDQKAAIDRIADAQVKLIEAQTKTCIEAYTAQTDKLNADMIKQKELAKQLLDALKIEEDREIQLINNNKKLVEENASIDKITDKNMKDLSEDKKKTVETKMVALKNAKEESKHDRFVRLYIDTNYVKNNLYEFVNQCRLLDSVPEWRAKITTLMVGYLTSYVVDPNDKTKHTSVLPSYGYFNLVLQGTPGVGKSYSSAIIGKALKWCGFLTVGKMKEIKKPDIVGSYTGQTAPKVYNELTQGLGNVVFIDEAYSIAGAKDQVKGTFNEFGQEALDAITDYTSEHIGLFAFIVAGYEYEMQNQFLNVNIGLPRRFPTVLTLRRYDMKSFWKILEMPIIKFSPKYQVNHYNRACFELLNIMFNFQWTPNPVLQISKNWSEWWESYNLKNLKMNLKINMLSKGKDIIDIPFLNLSEFDKKIKDIKNNNITATSINVLPLTELIGGDINMVTSTFVKAYFIYKFCGITNGDFFRNQADNLTKFGQIMLEDKVINPSKLFVPEQDNNHPGNIKWIEYVYFNLYFINNPNKPVYNIEFSFKDPTGEPTSEQSNETKSTDENETKSTDESNDENETKSTDENETKSTDESNDENETKSNDESNEKGGSKIKQYTKKNIKAKKYTRRNNGKKNKKTIHKYKNKKHKKTIRQRGGDQESYTKFLGIINQINEYFEESKKDNYKNIYDGGPNDPGIGFVFRLFTDSNHEVSKEVTDLIGNLTIPELEQILPQIKHTIDECYAAQIANGMLSDKGMYSDKRMYSDKPHIKGSVQYTLGKLNQLYDEVTAKANAKVKPDDMTSFVDRAVKASLKERNNAYSEANTNVKPLEPTNSANTPVPNSLSSEVPLEIKPLVPNKEEKIEDVKPEQVKTEEELKKQKEEEELKKQKEEEELKKQKEEEELKKRQKEEEELKKIVEEIEKQKLIDKDLVFDIVGIDFSAFTDTEYITENIVRNKTKDNEINNKKESNENLKTIFVTFMKKYNEYLTIFENNEDMNEKQKKDLPIFIYTYLLLACYNTSFMESKKPLTKFNNDSWWFFTAGDFKQISDYLDIEKIIDNFNKNISVKQEEDK